LENPLLVSRLAVSEEALSSKELVISVLKSSRDHGELSLNWRQIEAQFICISFVIFSELQFTYCSTWKEKVNNQQLQQAR
jgi:hypothetical protein